MRLPKDVRVWFQKAGRKGGKARARNLTPAELTEQARKAANARWSETKRKLGSC